MSLKRILLPLTFACALSTASPAQVPPNCQPQWIPTYGGFPSPTWDTGTVLAMVVFHDGHGPALYAGGNFGPTYAPHSNIARWDGWGWTQIGTDMTGGGVRALAVFDDGSGPALYVGGSFTSVDGVAADRIAKWDGTSWSAVGSGPNGLQVSALHVFDDGSGPALYVGGTFNSVGGVSANNIARWNGTTWSALSTGVNGGVTALQEFDDGTGPALFVGGSFTAAGATTCNRIAKWDGTSWSALGSGMTGNSGLSTNYVNALEVFDDGSGPQLYAGGRYTLAGGVPANRIAKWNGTSWSALGSGTSGPVSALTVFDDGSGRALYVGGAFLTAGGLTVNSFAKWNSSGWSALGSGVGGGTGQIAVLTPFDDGSGLALYVGGSFMLGSNYSPSSIARWDTTGLSQQGIGIGGSVLASAMFDDGTGSALYAGGSFRRAGGADAVAIAKWDGSRWSALPNNPIVLLWEVVCMAAFDDGSGPALYVSDVSFNSPITRWNGTAWANVGLSNCTVLQVLDTGSGPALYAVAGLGGRNVYRKTASGWASIGNPADTRIRALAVFDDGSGPALYAGGDFTSMGGQPMQQLAKWNGTAWIAAGPGVTGGSYPGIYTLQAFDDGSSPALYAGGNFDAAGGVTVNKIAKWDGANWSALGSGVTSTGSPYAIVSSLAVFDGGLGPQLIAAGTFDDAGGTASHGLAQWDGSNWSDLGLGLGARAPQGNSIGSLTVADDGSLTGTALIVCGGFVGTPGGDAFIAKWDLPIGCMPIGSSFCSPGSGGVMPCPCGNPPAGARLGCDNSAATGGARLAATGLASLSNDLALLTSSGELPSATSIVLQGTAQIAGGAVFGQGVRCVAGSLKRLYTKSAVLGSIVAPEALDESISARSAALGDTITAGSHRYYGVYYRDPNVLGGCAATSTFNVTQQVDLLWAP